MKTTEMIARVKDAQDFLIVNNLGRTIRTDTMRDLGFVLYTIVHNVQLNDIWYLCDAKNLGTNTPVVILVGTDHDAVGPVAGDQPTINEANYIIDCVNKLEFDSFGELENWSKVTEEEATLLLTKAPTEPVKDEPGIDLFKQVFDLIGLKYDEYDISDVNDEYAQFLHRKEDRYVDIMFDKGLVQIGHAGNSEPPRKLKITLVSESNEPCTGPDTRTGHEVKAS